MNSLSYADDIVREYLIFRGLTKTASMFEAEKKTSKLRGGFQASKVIEQLLSYVHSCNLTSLLELWEYLNRNFFLRLDKDMSFTVKKLEQSLKRYYLVYCCTSGHMDRVEEFFEALAPDLLRDPEWRHWFALRYLKSPASDPAFELYFSKQWLDVFMVSLHNFLATIFQSVPLPKILNFNAARAVQRGLEQEVDNLHSEIKRLKELVESSELQLETYRRKEKERELQQPSSQQQAAQLSSAQLAQLHSHPMKNLLSPQREHPLMQHAAPNSSPGPTPVSSSTVLSQPSSTNSSNPGSLIVGTSATSGVGGDTESPSSSAGTASAGYGSTWLPAYSIGRDRGSVRGMSVPALLPLNTPSTSSASSTTASSSVTPAPASAPGSTNSVLTAPAAPSASIGSIFDTDTDEPFLVLQQDIYSGHTAPVQRARFSSEGTYIGSAAADGVVRVWNTASPSNKPAAIACSAEVTSISWDHKVERLLAIGTASGKVKLWNAQSEKMLAEVQVPGEHSRIEELAFSPSGNALVTACNHPERLDEGLLHIWNTKTMKPEYKIEIEPPAGVRSICWNHNGTLLLTGTTDGMIRLFDMTSYSPIMGWRGHEGSVLRVKFSLDETTIFTLGSHGKLQQWSVNHIGKCERSYELDSYTLPPEIRSANDIALDPDRGRYFAVGARTCALVFSTEASKPVQKLSGHTRPVTCIDWHHHLVLTGSVDHTLRVTKLAHQFTTM